VAQRRGGSEDEGGGGAPAWMVTYGDMMTLLLTFFVLLLSFSTVHEEEFRKAMASLQGALGVLQAQRAVIRLPKAIPEVSRPGPSVQDVATRMARYIKVRGLSQKMRVRRVAGGFKITMQNPALFELGKAELTADAQQILTDIGSILRDLSDFNIEVEGHTDNLPIHTEEFPSNLELSIGRSLTVANFFIDKHGFDRSRISVAGFGENKPVASNDTAAGRAQNRRVEINVLEQAIPVVPMSKTGLPANKEVAQYGT